jgi:hypothetical protein
VPHCGCSKVQRPASEVTTWAPLRLGFYKEGKANMIAAAFPFRKQQRRVLGTEMV